MTVKKSESSISKITDPYVFLFSLTLFTSASLTFTIQPMVGKLLLPLVGGAPSGWLVTMAYFQIVLLGGYTIAHLLSRLKTLGHIAVVFVFLLAGFLMFPLSLKSEIIETSGLPEAGGVFLTLCASLTLPCLALFTLSPTLQRLFYAGSSKSGRNPYFLFAASNLGSLGGLLSYPLVIEHVSGLSAQTRFWQIGYGILIGLYVVCLLCSYRQLQEKQEIRQSVTAPSIDWKTRGWWVLLAFIPSSLMLGVTAHVTSDLGTVPFFWVLPLTLYLLTFILAFAKRRIFGLTRLGYFQTASVAVMMAFFIKEPALVAAPEQMLFPVIAFFLTALYCHFTLASNLPDSQRLTEFYLWIALGGALGGMFNTFVAPFVFPLPLEFTLVVLLSCQIHPARTLLQNPKVRNYVIAAWILAIVPAILCAGGVYDHDATRNLNIAIGTLLLILLVVISLSARALVSFSLIFGLLAIMTHNSNTLDVHRDFFGIMRVVRDTSIPDMVVRKLYHGSTLHGLEEVEPKVDTTAHSYYEGPLGDIFGLTAPENVGLIGLGSGIVLCYQASGRHFTVYELDPAVPVIANKWFDYIKTCGNPEMVIGDGRRMMARMDEQYNLLIIDAFTSDAIPMQLLTKEAFQVYLDHLEPNGVLTIHISNRFYDLRQPISNIVNNLGLHALYKTIIQPPTKPLNMSSRWVVVARNEEQLEPLRKQDWRDLPVPNGPVWTDDFSDVLSSLVFLHPKPPVTNAQTH